MERVLASVVEKLGNLLLEEGIFLYGVKDQVKWVETELKMMQSFLEDASNKQRKGDKRIKNWVREVTNVSYDAEDAIDTYVLQVERRRQQQGLFGYIRRYASVPSLLMARHKLGKDIDDIKLKIEQISKGTSTYKIGNLGETIGKEDEGIDELHESRKRPPLLDVNDYTILPVGFEVHRQRLVNQLLSSDTKRRYVVSIVGMGGIGKSTLAKMVYNDSEISEKFPIRIWITASEDFQLRPFLEDVAMKTIGNPGGMLEQRIHDFLKDKVYFLIIDDVWRTDVWPKIEAVLPDVGNGSRVLLTTRSESVARSAEPIIPFFLLPLLKDEESWALFVRKAFPTEQVVDSVCPQEFEALGRRMVKRCGRLPLALLVLGGLLSSKTTPHSWLQVEETMDWESIEDENRCLHVLALSYRNLPDHNFRSCFLYLAMFPEDFAISASELTRLWIAEGFIPKKRNETLEDTARRYLDNLIQRSMIQVWRRKSDGSVSKIKIHDMLREMCLAESKEDRFFNIIPSSSGGTNYNSTGSEDNFSQSRRLAIYHLVYENGNYIDSRLPSNLRSLFLYSIDRSSNRGQVQFWKFSTSKMLHGLKFLGVLELQGIEDTKGFPKPINSMTHLRYLKLSCIRKLPSAIGNFRSLQTLDLRDSWLISKLPKELGELPNLRHVFVHDVYFPAISTSTELQTLKRIRCDQLWAQESLPRLQNLRRLGIELESGNGEILCDSISNLNHLAYLSVGSKEIPDSIITNLSVNPHIVKLVIKGRFVPRACLPESGNFPPNLTKLSLWASKLKEDPMPVLEKLPNLMSLHLNWNSYAGNKMVCTTDGFLRLQGLELNELNNLEDWIVQAGAFPKLAYLQIEGCRSLKMLPQGLQHVTSLMELRIFDQQAEFRDNLRKDVGADWYKIKHVPISIILDHRPPFWSEAHRPLFWKNYIS